MDWLLMSVAPIVAGVAAAGCVLLQWRIRKSEELVGSDEGAKSPHPLTREVREEINQEPAWWDREMHWLLAATQPKIIVNTEDEYIEESTFTTSFVYMIPKPFYYDGCPCQQCDNARLREMLND